MPMLDGYSRGEGEMDLVATHQRLLVGSVMRTTGPILELGVGWYSTPILHELAEVLERPLLTLDNNMDWLAQFLPLQSEFHKLELVGWWGDAPLEREHRWGLVFVDQGQPIEREYAIRRLINRTDVFVCHDADEPFAYGFCRTLPMFKYVWYDKCQKVWTAVVSNTVDVRKWFLPLPPVEPTSSEVT